MNMATVHYVQNWQVEDVHGRGSYDLLCRRAGEVRHVEVKGTTTNGAEVILTPNEVRHTRENEFTALFVLGDVHVGRADDGTVTATLAEFRASMTLGPSMTASLPLSGSATRFRGLT